MSPELVFILLLSVKHLVVDFFMQPEYMWRNKGNISHPGGYLHAFLHVVGSSLAVAAMAMLGLLPVTVTVTLFAVVMLAEFVLHYAIDWGKMNYNAARGWAANTHPQFWYLTGFDQFLHTLTYIVMVAVFFH